MQSRFPDRKQTQRSFIQSEAQKMLNLLIAERADYCASETKRDRLEHQALGGLARLHVDVTASAGPIFRSCTFKVGGDADHRWRAGDPFLAARCIK
jgi:hypothetical protein